MSTVNWFAVIFLSIFVIFTPVGMAAVLIRDRVRRKRREKRLHQPIRSWWEMRAEQ